MTQPLNDIEALFKDDYYVTVATEELELEILPFYSLPARKVADLYNNKLDLYRFVKKIYNLIHIAMKNPKEFNDKVSNKSITYSGLVDFLNKWVYVSSSAEEKNRAKQTVTNSQAVLEIINARLLYGEEIQEKLLIRYFIENIKEAAVEHNKTCKPADKIIEVVIEIPIGDEYE